MSQPEVKTNDSVAPMEVCHDEVKEVKETKEEIVGLDGNPTTKDICVELYAAAPSKENNNNPQLVKSELINQKYLEVCVLFKTTLDADKDGTKIPVYMASSQCATAETFDDLMWFIKQCKGVDCKAPEKPLRSKVMAEIMDVDIAKRIDEIYESGLTRLYNLITAANWANFDGLLKCACAKVASLIKNVPLDQIKNKLDPQLQRQGVLATST